VIKPGLEDEYAKAQAGWGKFNKWYNGNEENQNPQKLLINRIAL
jgi:hypothetical protein